MPRMATGYWNARNTPSGPDLRRHGEQIVALIQHPAGGDGVGRMTRENLGERALARAVRSHDRVHLAGVDGEVDAREDLPSLDRGVEVLDLQQRTLAQPTLPSRLMPSNRCASTANSIGSSLKTSLQKPLTIIDTASSAERPRCFA